MNVAEFIAAFRADLVDNDTPPLWSDADIVRYLNDAIQEANERAFLTEDRATPAVCSITLTAGVSTYNLHPSVIRIKRLTYLGRPMVETSVEAMDCESSNWESRSGEPRRYIFEQASGVNPAKVRLWPTPTSAGTLALTVNRGAS